MFPYTGHQLRSIDDRFIVFFPPGATIYTREFENQINAIFPDSPHDLVDKQHLLQLKGEITSALGEETGRNWKKHVHYSSSEVAAKKFNADTVITYSIKLAPENYYKGKYSNVWTLTLQKNGSGYITMHCLYEDMSQVDLDRYQKAVKSIFRFEE